MTPTFLNEAASQTWTVEAPKAASNVQVASVKLDGKTPLIQLLPKGKLGAISTPWAPSAYRGTGAEERVSATYNIPDELREELELCEEKIRDGLRKHVPKIDSLWHSSTKPSERNGSSLRTKITIAGEDACPCFNMEGDRVPLPTQWVGLSVVPIVMVRGAYIQRTIAGVMLETVALLIGDVKPMKRRELEDVSFL